MISYFQAIVIGLLQGVTELFPVSSLGHSVLLPALLGWHQVVASQSARESFYLAFLVGLHVATALALLWFYRDQWARIVAAVGPHRRGTGPVAAHPAHRDRRRAPRLAAGRRQHPRRAPVASTVAAGTAATDSSAQGRARELSSLGFGDALLIGATQILAFFAGISRSGVTMVAGLARGLDHEADLLGPNGNGVRGQVLAGSVVAAFAAYLSVRFLTRYFQTRTLTPFAIYCLLVGAACIVRFA